MSPLLSTRHLDGYILLFDEKRILFKIFQKLAAYPYSTSASTIGFLVISAITRIRAAPSNSFGIVQQAVTTSRLTAPQQTWLMSC